MKKNYALVSALAMLIFSAAQVSAQSESAIPNAKKQPDGKVITQKPANQNGENPNVPRPAQSGKQQNVVPAPYQFHSPIRWYAIENADNPKYWEHVNTERIWLELEIGKSLQDDEIAAFIAHFELGEPVRKSMHPHLTNFYVFVKEGNTAADVIEMARAASELSGVLFLEPSVLRTGQFVPNDPMWNQQWGPYLMYFDMAWDYGYGGNSWNVIAVIDDAIDWQHEDLYNQVWYGWDYGFNDANPSPDGAGQDHGTHVTGTIAASTNNGIGVAGMCMDTVYFAKVTDNSYWTNNGVYSDAAIINAVYDISGISRVTVINLSLGGGAPSASEEQAYNYAWNNGKLAIVSSGNESNSTVSYPAAYPANMAVGSLGFNGTSLYLAGYSNYGEQQEVTAPGGDMSTNFGIISTVPNNQYAPMEGTSMAAPHVAGLAGLMKNLNPDLTNVDIRNIINATCLDLGPEGWDQQFGYGMVNAQLAVEMAIGISSTGNEFSGTEMKLYPNPATEQIWIHYAYGANASDVEIFDMSGKMVHQHRSSFSELFSINVSDLPQGVYVVRMNANNQMLTGRFIKAF